MCANDYVGLIPLDHFDEGARIELVECKAAAFVLPGLVELIVKPPHHIRHVIHHIYVGFRVEMAKQLVRIIERVNVSDLFGCAHFDASAFDGLSRSRVARS